MDLIKLAKQYSENGYSVLPVTREKIPSIREWGIYQTRPMREDECEKHFKGAWGIALLMGGDKCLTAIDIDTKYFLDSDMFARYKDKVGKDILKKMYVQSTKNNGFHFVFSCDKVEGNQKLASRYTTPQEQNETYLRYYAKPETRDKALKMASNDSERVLIETRGHGGYILIAPSEGYTHLAGKIQKITEDEYDLLLESAREMNEVKEVKKNIKTDKYDRWELSPFEDYNERGDVLDLLISNGWEDVGRGRGKDVPFKRPGGTATNKSALFDTESRVFNVFSTSTSFDVNRGYTPSDLFIELEADGDVSESFKKLIQMDYGKE